MTIRVQGNLLLYPDRGRLLFATDFHGNLEDFRAVVARYRARRAAGEDLYLLFAGDFVHGPGPLRGEWPAHLGDAYADETPQILAELEALVGADPRVRSLLGNHEHGHVGGPHTQKFHLEPDEVEYLEAWLGPERTAAARTLFRTFALCALLPCGVMLLHGAPNVRNAGFGGVARAVLDGYVHMAVPDMFGVPIVGELLWSRGARPEVAEAFFTRMAYGAIRPRVAVFGHDVVDEGWSYEAANQVLVSTSFGVPRARKTLCELDLAGRYAGARDLRPGYELVPLYPEG